MTVFLCSNGKLSFQNSCYAKLWCRSALTADIFALRLSWNSWVFFTAWYSIQFSSSTSSSLSDPLTRLSNNVLVKWNLTLTNADIIYLSSIRKKHAYHYTYLSTYPQRHLTTNQPQRLLLVITYNPALRYVSSIINKHFNSLSSFPRCINVFKAKPFIASSSDGLTTLVIY